MRQINGAIVKGGSLVLSNLPFENGQHVRVVVDEMMPEPGKKYSIEEVRRRLKGGVTKFEDPTEPAIPFEDWDVFK